MAPLLTPQGDALVQDLAQRHGVSTDAVIHLLLAVNSGGGTMAQFNHPDLGGMGQWTQGGMIMVGDMFNQGLKAQVDGLCSALSQALAQHQVLAPRPSSPPGSGFGPQSGQGFGPHPGPWWPEDLGQPTSTGSQNQMRYAVFPHVARLAVTDGSTVRVFDTQDHQIGGVSQQQGSGQTLSFSSQYGTFTTDQLRLVSDPAPSPQPEPDLSSFSSQDQPPPSAAPSPSAPSAEPASPTPGSLTPIAPALGSDEIFSLIEKVADLHSRGILSEDEFQAKKADLLSRL